VLFEIMAKIEKKKAKLLERIQLLENEMIESLTKKTSTTREINVPSMTRQIDELKKQLRDMK
jgi:polyhydroxyalkanoate synthesis regulator phasin